MPVENVVPISPAVDRRIRVTVFLDKFAKTKKERVIRFRNLLPLMEKRSAARKSLLPFIKLATFGDEKSDAGCYRTNDNMISIDGIEVDYDAGTMSLDEAMELVRAAGVAAIFYTSASHTPDNPRWRCLCPTSRTLPKEDRKELVARLNGVLKGALAPESFVDSQSYYYGRIKSNPHYRCEIVDGQGIDQAIELEPLWKGGKKKEKQASEDNGELNWDFIARELEYIPVKIRENRQEIWLPIAMALHDASGGSEAAWRVLDEWSYGSIHERCKNYNYDENRATWESLGRNEHEGGGITFATLIYIVRQYGGFQEYRIADGYLIVNPAAPYKVAQTFVAIHFKDELHRYRGEFFCWSGRAYTAFADEAVRSRLYSFLDNCRYRLKDELLPVNPKLALVTNVADALRAVVHLDDSISPPFWLDGRDRPPADEIVACASGLLHLPTLELLPHTPAFFTPNALDFAYDPDAPPPEQWLDFLDELWPDDPFSIRTLQEIFGLALTGDTSYQKMFLLIGPARSGKGTIARILTRLIGLDNMAGPTLAGLTKDFVLAKLIGKQLAIISDARLGGRADQQAIVERLLSITGEDTIDIDRKYVSVWTGRLKVRFVVLSNELPRLGDTSGALASRFIVLLLTKSFLGREDRGLTERLSGELPGILNWSIAGWQRLNKRGHFRQPKTAAQALQQLEDLSSPVKVFLRERCDLAPGVRAKPDDLYTDWGLWCDEQGRKYISDLQQFGRDLHAAIPGLKVVRPRIDGRQVRMYEGIKLKNESDEIEI